jgi:hypothetical protein
MGCTVVKVETDVSLASLIRERQANGTGRTLGI